MTVYLASVIFQFFISASKMDDIDFDVDTDFSTTSVCLHVYDLSQIDGLKPTLADGEKPG